MTSPAAAAAALMDLTLCPLGCVGDRSLYNDMSIPVASCSGRMIKERPAEMYINCSAFSAFMASRGLVTVGLQLVLPSLLTDDVAVADAAGVILDEVLAGWELDTPCTATAEVVGAGDSFVGGAAGVWLPEAACCCCVAVAANNSALSFWASFFSKSFSSLRWVISACNDALAFMGSDNILVKISMVDSGGIKHTRYFPYTRSVNALRSRRVCSMAVCKRKRAS